MKHWHPIVMALAVMGAAALGAPAPAAAAEKIAVINVQRILEESSAGRIARDLLEQSTKRARAEIEGLRDDLKQMQERYQGQKAVLKPDAIAELEQQMMETQMELQQKLRETQSDLQNRDMELTSAILDELQPIIDKIAEEKDLTMILEKGEAGVLYAEERLDLTDLVLDRYDQSKQSKRSGSSDSK